MSGVGLELLLGMAGKLKNAAMGVYYFARLATCRSRRGFYGAHFLNAFEGDTVRRAFDRWAGLGSSAEALRRMPDSAGLLADRPGLGRLPPGSLGRAYLDFLTVHDISGDFINEAADLFSRMRGEDGPRTWFRRHVAVAHDLRHVIAGYDISPRGEFCILCFSFGQTRHAGVGALALFAGARAVAKGDFGILRSGAEAHRRGREGVLFDLLPWELCLDAPLAVCREALGLSPPRLFPAPVAPDAYVEKAADSQLDPEQSFAAVLAAA